MYQRIYLPIVVVLLAMMAVEACATAPAEKSPSPEVTPTTRKHPRKTPIQPTPVDYSFTYPFPNPDPNQIKNTPTPLDTESPYPFPYVGPAQAQDSATPVLSPTPTDVPVKREIIYQESGLIWQECNLAGKSWQMAEECLGRSLPDWSAADRQRLGEQIGGIGPITQTIGSDIYVTKYTGHHNRMQEEYALLKNNEVITTITSTMWAYDPNQSLINVGGKIAWEFADHEHPTIFYDGKDLRSAYNLEAAYMPYDFGGKLLFVARKDGIYFVDYDGQQLGPAFDEISIAYCCEPAGESIRRLQGQYWFWGSRNGKNYIVVITAIR